ncbi:hypothetical protein [Compostimonas suwonensis]|nr:hypothetical protein [Compostimonas suwonensis]
MRDERRAPEPDQQMFLYTAKKDAPSADAIRILASWQLKRP